MYSNIKAVLFDKDGTLLDYHRTWAPVNRRAAAYAAAGDGALEDHLLTIGGMDPVTGVTSGNSTLAAGNTLEIAETWVKQGAAVPQDELVQALDELFHQTARSAVAVDNIGDNFRTLSGLGMKIGIASSDNENAIRIFAEHFGLSPYIHFIAGYDSGYGHKPGPGMLQAFCQATNIRPEHTAVVGDNLHDMEMARAGGAGLRVGVLTGTGTRQELSRESHVCLQHMGSFVDLLVAELKET